MLFENPDIAIVLLDVVMETSSSGLDLIKYIREDLNNQFIRIVLRTGQPGVAPENEVVSKYDINDYQTKADLTEDKIFTVITAGLRAYESLKTIEDYSKNLEKKVEERTKKIAEQNKELEIQRDELRKLNATKDKFFELIAHDMKNSFTALISIAQSLTDSYHDIDENDKHLYITKVYKSSNNLFNLLQNLLHWATTQTGRMSYSPVKLNLNDIVDDNIQLLYQHAEKKGILLNANLDEAFYVFADKNMLQTILRNLISNAIKFTCNGGRVHVSAVQTGKMVEVTVKDSGIGMTNDEVNKLFRIETKNKSIGHSKEKGTGLGLILSKEFVEMNNGKIWVESEPEKGSTFKFTLPLTSE